MGKSAIDWDRGVTIKSGDKPTSIQVYMYKDDPGVFLNTYGDPVPDTIAAEAGFDIESLSRAREMKRRLAQAMEDIQKELGVPEGTEYTVKEKDGLRIVPFGLHFHIKDARGNVLSPIPLDKDSALLLLDKLTDDPKSKKPAVPAAREKAQEEADTTE